ncbi:hypothetical protein DEO23_03525 [Brachybacterium endophyticum]|uniref:SURF1-like protein n=1 Tax=Brachybacterium endophyticum TaxID=2182385 RepID=A0A2U2RPL5_9MICO|nr:SURF1 family cytochrome oxidase biogenesis protein [Brachybacterium endophyticum]PWH07704.1 hypothetical protein DEO23_03525 [Brachybacterium endophyticum]
MLRVALRPRFMGLLALMVVATLVCGLLATWQWDRAHRAMQQQSAVDRSLGSIQDVVQPGDAVTNSIQGGIVRAEGSYDPDQQVLVPGRRIDGEDAVIVVTALHVRTDDGTTALLPVARGWVPEEDVTGKDGQPDPGRAPAPPSGRVDVSGRLEASESASQGIEHGIAQEIATPLLVNEWGEPMYAGYVGVDHAADGLRAMPAAESAFSTGLNWQNLGYALQWVLFGGFFLYLWWRSVRTAYLDELAERRERMQSRLALAEGEDPVAAHEDDDHPTVGPAGADPTVKGETGADSASTR